MTTASSGLNQTFEFAAFNGITEIPKSKLQNKYATGGDVTPLPGGGLIFLEKGDRVWFGLKNTTSASDFTISEGFLKAIKTS